MDALHTSVVNEHISIKSIPEENYVLLVSEVYVSPREEVRIEAEWRENSCQLSESVADHFFKR